MATQQDINTGAAALQQYVESVNWFEGEAVPWSDYEQGSALVLNAWDSIGPADNPDALALKKANCGMALYKEISDAGYQKYVTPEECENGALAVLTAAGRDLNVVTTS